MEKDTLFEYVVSPPEIFILYLFCSLCKEFEIFFKFASVNFFLFPLPDIK